MKKTITRTFFLLCAGLFTGILLTGCEGDSYYTGADMETTKFTVYADDWNWNSRYARYEYVFDWNEIDEYMFEQGVVTAGVFISEYFENNNQTYWVLRSLPFVHTYPDRGANYTQTIGFDISYPSRQIAFYIQSSDLSQTKPNLDNYQFKVTIFWEQ